MVCSHCGKAVPDGARICASCGGELGNTSSAAAARPAGARSSKFLLVAVLIALVGVAGAGYAWLRVQGTRVPDRSATTAVPSPADGATPRTGPAVPSWDPFGTDELAAASRALDARIAEEERVARAQAASSTSP